MTNILIKKWCMMTLLTWFLLWMPRALRKHTYIQYIVSRLPKIMCSTSIFYLDLVIVALINTVGKCPQPIQRISWNWLFYKSYWSHSHGLGRVLFFHDLISCFYRPITPTPSLEGAAVCATFEHLKGEKKTKPNKTTACSDTSLGLTRTVCIHWLELEVAQ